MLGRIFSQTKQIEAARVAPLNTRFVKYDKTDAGRCTDKLEQMNELYV